MDGRNEEIVGRAIKGKETRFFGLRRALAYVTSKEDIVKM